MERSSGPDGGQSATGLKLKKLDLDQVRHIDDMLASVGDYGEVHLIVQHGELRYINRVESHKAWKTSGNDNGNGRGPNCK